MPVDEALLGELTTTIGEWQLTQEQAQVLVDLGAKQAQAIMAQVNEQQSALNNSLLEAFNTAEGSVAANEFPRPALLEEQVLQWEAATKKDKLLGGDKLEANLATAKLALDSFGSPELKQFLAKSGLGSHPEVIRMLHKVGSSIGDDQLVIGHLKPGETEKQNQTPVQKLANSGIYDQVRR